MRLTCSIPNFDLPRIIVLSTYSLLTAIFIYSLMRSVKKKIKIGFCYNSFCNFRPTILYTYMGNKLQSYAHLPGSRPSEYSGTHFSVNMPQGDVENR